MVQLAVRYPPYRRLLAKILIDDPRILALPIRTRFKKLIHEPWKALQESYPQCIAAPPVVVSCWYPDCTEELLLSICEFSSSPHSSPLLWIISIDRNAKLPIRDIAAPFGQFGFVRLPVCYDDGPSDAALILHHPFRELRQRHEELFDKHEKWPSDEQMPQLIRLVSGVFESVDDIISFVDRQDGGGPKAHLETLLAYTVDSPSPSDERPYCTIDHFYTHAFASIPPHLLPIVNKILSVIYHTNSFSALSPLQIACLLSIEQFTVLRVYAYLSGWAIGGTEKWYATSQLFKDFLKRSGKLWHNNVQPGPTFLELLLSFLGCSSNLLGFMKLRVRSIPVTPNAYGELEGLRRTVLNMFYVQYIASLSGRIPMRHFDFRCLAYNPGSIIPQCLTSFLCRLRKVDSSNIVRVESASSLDSQFIGKCEGVAEPFDFDSQLLPLSPKYILLGSGNETVLVLLEIAEFSFATNEPRHWVVDVYTSAMLEFM